MKLLVSRLATSVVLIFAVSASTFFMMSLLPTDAASVILGMNATPERYEAMRVELGLDQPVWVQYTQYMESVLGGDLGNSIFTGEPVDTAIGRRLPVTLSLLIPSLMVYALVGVGFGYLAAVAKGSLRRVLDVVVLIGGSLPSFWLALVLVSYFAVSYRWFPAIGYVPISDGVGMWAQSLVLPVVALSITGIAGVAKITRDGVLDALDQDYVRTLRAAGIGRLSIYFKHILKSSGALITTILGLIFIGSLAGSVFVESVFALPGLGSLAVSATSNGDIPIIQGVALTMTLFVIVVNILVDLSYLMLNPRGRLS